MKQARDREQLWAELRNWRRSGHTIALVPTMGNLHEGHLALVAAAREHADRVVVSIYVNPTQFGEGEDLERYPRTLDDDLRQLAAAQCDLAFVPGDRTMYPKGIADATRVKAAPSLTAMLEGATRPGHFDGVVTVVSRLFNMVRPDVAVFGEKDYQQLLVVRRLVEDMGYPLRVLAVPTVRGPRGLALSSRNRYLDDDQRAAAEQLNEVLMAAAEQVIAGRANWEEVERLARAGLEERGLRVDYVAVRRSTDLEFPKAQDTELRVLAAVWCGDTRLIDNVRCAPG
jgi:pantoate--beta-alanine ligase